jgi:2-aminoadipate transaminase
MVVAPAEIARVLAPTKQALDMSTSTNDQAAAAIYLEGVDWERLTSELRAASATLMTAVDRLAEVLPHGSVFTRPTDRIFVWAPLADG